MYSDNMNGEPTEDVKPLEDTRDTRDEDRDRDGDRDRDREEPRQRSDDKRGTAPQPCNVLGVFGLSVRTVERDLEELFSKYGEVEKVTIVYDQRESDRSRGFGFIRMATTEDATKCIEHLNGQDVNGRRIRVDYSLTNRAHDPTPGRYMGVHDRDRRSSRYGDSRYGGGYSNGRDRDRDRGSYRDRDRYDSYSSRDRDRDRDDRYSSRYRDDDRYDRDRDRDKDRDSYGRDRDKDRDDRRDRDRDRSDRGDRDDKDRDDRDYKESSSSKRRSRSRSPRRDYDGDRRSRY